MLPLCRFSCVISLVAIWACTCSDAAALVPALPKGAKLAFQDDFNRKELGSYPQGNIDAETRAKLNWCVRKGTWELRRDEGKNGYLFGSGPDVSVVLDKQLGSNFRLEYTAWSANPGDRSAFLCVPLANFRYEDIYGFHFAGGFSKYNILVRQRRGMTKPVKSPLPKPGQKWRVVVQKTDELLEMFVDGRAVISKRDERYGQVREKLASPLGTCVGLYTYSDGMCFDDLKVYRLPEPRREVLPKEATVARMFWRGFETDAAGPLPRDADVQVGAGCSVRVIDEPTVVYHPEPEGQGYVTDHAVEIRDDDSRAETSASVTFPFGPRLLLSGEVEVEMLAWSYEGDCVALSLVDQKGTELAKVVIDEDGVFHAQSRQGRDRLLDVISYRNRPRDARLWLQPKRWFTIRLSFNVRSRIYHAALTNLYSGLGRPGIDPYVRLGSDLPLLAKGAVSGLKISTLGAAHLLIDNVCVASPRAVQLNGRAYTVPLREILGLTYPLRKDPVSLSAYSLRNEFSRFDGRPGMKYSHRRRVTEPFMRRAAVHDRLLVRYAMFEERGLVLARMAYHLGQPDLAAEAKAVLERVEEAKHHLERLLRVYGRAYRDSLNEEALGREFDPAAKVFGELLGVLEQETSKLGKACVAALAGRAEAAPELVLPAHEAPAVWRNGRFERGGKPTAFYVPMGCRGADMVARGNAHRLLGLDNCWIAPFILDRPKQKERPDTQTFSWRHFDAFMTEYVLKGNPDAQIGCRSQIGNHYLTQVCPAWWLEKHKDDMDIFFCRRDGTPQKWKSGMEEPYHARRFGGALRYFSPGGYQARLNYWNPKVKEMYRSMLEEWSRYVSETHPGRAKYFLVCAEPTGSAMTETGFNLSAVAAFREQLPRKYKTIAMLNKAWNTSYASFEDIDPCKYSSARPNGLMYEFELFRHEGYFEWMDLMKASLKEHLPDVALLNDFHNALDRPFDSGIDAVGMFKSYDVVGNHYYGKHASQPLWMHRLLDSLRKAYGTALCNFEWIGDVRCPDIFDQDAFKACGLMDMFEQMAWGRSMLAIWYGGSAGFAEGGQYWVPNLGQSVLRYSTTYIPIGRLRFRRFGQIALTYPTVTPKVAVMEPTTSYLNGIHVRDTMEEVSVALGERQWNFGYIHEHALLEGAQSLDGIKTLIVPRGVCLKTETSQALLAWMQEGNTLIALLPPGLLNQHGQPDGRLLRAAVGEARWSANDEFTEATVDGAKATITPVGDALCKLVKARCGKGLLAVYTVSDPFPQDHLLGLVEEHTPRDVFTASGLFRVVLRESGKHLYLFVVNPDLYDAQEDEIVLVGQHSGAVDLGCDVAFPVRSQVSEGSTRLRLRLASGEGTVVRVSR